MPLPSHLVAKVRLGFLLLFFKSHLFDLLYPIDRSMVNFGRYLDPVHFRQIDHMLATHIKPFDSKLVQKFHRAPLFVILLTKRRFNRFKRHRNFDLQWL